MLKILQVFHLRVCYHGNITGEISRNNFTMLSHCIISTSCAFYLWSYTKLGDSFGLIFPRYETSDHIGVYFLLKIVTKLLMKLRDSHWLWGWYSPWKKFSTSFFLYFWLLNHYKCSYQLIKRPGSDTMTWWFGERYRGWSDKDIMRYYKRLFADRFLLLWFLFWIVITVQFVMVFFIFNC